MKPFPLQDFVRVCKSSLKNLLRKDEKMRCSLSRGILCNSMHQSHSPKNLRQWRSIIWILQHIGVQQLQRFGGSASEAVKRGTQQKWRNCSKTISLIYLVSIFKSLFLEESEEILQEFLLEHSALLAFGQSVFREQKSPFLCGIASNRLQALRWILIINYSLYQIKNHLRTKSRGKRRRNEIMKKQKRVKSREEMREHWKREDGREN